MLNIRKPLQVKTVSKGNTKAYKFSIVVYADTFVEALQGLEDQLVDNNGSDFTAEDVS